MIQLARIKKTFRTQRSSTADVQYCLTFIFPLSSEEQEIEHHREVPKFWFSSVAPIGVSFTIVTTCFNYFYQRTLYVIRSHRLFGVIILVTMLAHGAVQVKKNRPYWHCCLRNWLPWLNRSTQRNKALQQGVRSKQLLFCHSCCVLWLLRGIEVSAIFSGSLYSSK